MADHHVPENARGRVRTSTFWKHREGSRDVERWRRGWWDAYDRRPLPRDATVAYLEGRAEYLEQFSAAGASSGEGSQLMTTTCPDNMVVVHRPLGTVTEHPRNPRSKEESAPAIAEMVDSIRRHGQMQPALVRRSDGLLIAGHVRKWARESLGLADLPCVEIECDDATAVALLLASNEHITPPDPLLEANAVDELLHAKRPGAIAWTMQQVADALGRPIRWVARRARLTALSPKFAAEVATGKLLQGWPVEWLERLAILERSAQDELHRIWRREIWRVNHIGSAEQLDRALAEVLHVLGKAPFDIHDPELVPKAGACVGKTDADFSCRKTTISRPGLFDDQVDGDPKTARCCDGACWASKVRAHVRADIDAAKAEHRDVVVVDPGSGAGGDALQGIDTVRDYSVSKCAGTSAGAKPALFVQPDGSVVSGYVRKHGHVGVGSKKAKKSAKPKEERSEAERLKASREAIAARRLAHVIDAVHEAVLDPKRPPPPMDDLQQLVAAYELEAPFKNGYGDHFHGDVARAKHHAAVALAGPIAFMEQLWGRVRKAVAASITRHGTATVRAEHALAEWIAERIGVDLAQLDVDAKEAIPNPRWWPSADVGPARRKKRSKGKAAAAGDEEPPAARKEKKSRKNPWARLTPAQRLARVNRIRKGRGLPPKSELRRDPKE